MKINISENILLAFKKPMTAIPVPPSIRGGRKYFHAGLLLRFLDVDINHRIANTARIMCQGSLRINPTIISGIHAIAVTPSHICQKALLTAGAMGDSVVGALCLPDDIMNFSSSISRTILFLAGYCFYLSLPDPYRTICN